MSTQDNIGNLFKDALQNHSESISIEEYEAMNQLISKNSFFRFNLRNFNVYYAAAIVSGFLITMTLAGHYIYTQSKLDKSRKNETVIPHTLPEASNLPKNKPEYDKAPINQNNTAQKIEQSKRSEETKNSTVILAPRPIQDKIESEPTTDLNKVNPQTTIEKDDTLKTNKTNLSSLPQKRTVVIIQKDTIYQIDTLRGKRPTKKKRK